MRKHRFAKRSTINLLAISGLMGCSLLGFGPENSSSKNEAGLTAAKEMVGSANHSEEQAPVDVDSIEENRVQTASLGAGNPVLHELWSLFGAVEARDNLKKLSILKRDFALLNRSYVDSDQMLESRN